MVEPHPDACLRLQIAQAVQPFGEGLPPVLAPVSQQVNHIALLYLKSYPLSHLFRAALIPSISTGSVAERPGQLQPCPPPRLTCRCTERFSRARRRSGTCASELGSRPSSVIPALRSTERKSGHTPWCERPYRAGMQRRGDAKGLCAKGLLNAGYIGGYTGKPSLEKSRITINPYFDSVGDEMWQRR